MLCLACRRTPSIWMGVCRTYYKRYIKFKFKINASTASSATSMLDGNDDDDDDDGDDYSKDDASSGK